MVLTKIFSLFKKYERTLLYTVLFVLIIYILSKYINSYIKEGLEGMNEGDTISGTTNDNGIKLSDIPEGDEDLYVLKSSIVPPVCPKCPDISITGCPQTNKCPPCPAPERCPEPSFECKKVPTFASNGRLPVPVLADFSQFGF